MSHVVGFSHLAGMSESDSESENDSDNDSDNESDSEKEEVDNSILCEWVREKNLLGPVSRLSGAMGFSAWCV